MEPRPKVRLKRIDDSLPLPRYYTQGAVGFDLYARHDVTIPAHALERIPTNLIIEVPAGYMLLLKDRSSTARKGLIATAGIVDQDFCGPEDEILFQVYNCTQAPVTVGRGERIAQGILIPILQVEWEELDSHHHKSRGGFGSSGDKT